MIEKIGLVAKLLLRRHHRCCSRRCSLRYSWQQAGAVGWSLMHINNHVLEISHDIIITLVSRGLKPLTLPGWSTIWQWKPFQLMALFSFFQTGGSSTPARQHLLPSLEVLRNRGSPPKTFTYKICAIKLPALGKSSWCLTQWSGADLWISCHFYRMGFPPSSSLTSAGNCRWLYTFQ